MSIYTPPSYSTTVSYPVLYLLHGSGGDEDAWESMGRVGQILDNMLASKEMEPMIVVMPNGNVDLDAAPGHGENKYEKPSSVNVSSMLGETEATFMKDIVGYVEANYPVIAGKEGRAIAGLSLGGLHTLYITLNHPEYFDYIGLFSAQASNAMTDNRIASIREIKEQLSSTLGSIPFLSKETVSNKIDDMAGSYSPENLSIYQDMESKLDTLFAEEPKLFYIALGKDDFVKKLNDDLREKLDEKHYEYIYNETDGGHTWSNWRKYLVDFLPRLFDHK